jgi:hypothetical protein
VLSNCCSPAAGALYYDDVSAAAAASQEKKRRITHFFYVASYLCRSSAFVRAACDDVATGPRSMRQQNKLRVAFVFAVFFAETPRFAACTPFYHAILEEKLKINCVSFNL